MNLYFTAPGFDTVKIQGVIPESLRFFGMVEGYDRKDNQSYNMISFNLQDPTRNEEVLDQLRNKFKLNIDVNEYVIKNIDNRIRVKFTNGSRGWADSPSFYFSND